MQLFSRSRKATLLNQNNSHVANAIQSKISNTATSQKFIASASVTSVLEPLCTSTIRITSRGWRKFWRNKARENLTNSINFSIQVLWSLENKLLKQNINRVTIWNKFLCTYACCSPPHCKLTLAMLRSCYASGQSLCKLLDHRAGEMLENVPICSAEPQQGPRAHLDQFASIEG